MNNDLISREALKKEFCVKFYTTPYYKHILDVIDNAPTVELTELCKGCQYLKDCETCEKTERPKESELVKAYTKGFDTGVETVRPKGDKDEYNCFHCKYASKPAYEEPCNKCKHSYDNKFEWDTRGEDNA